MRSINPGYGQFRWMVLLLAVAVILPTVCLLWFMNEVVKNERLAVRQKLITVYKNRLAEVTSDVDRKWDERGRLLEERSSVHPYQQFVSAAGRNGYDGLLLYDAAGQRLYPALSVDVGALARPSEVFADAWDMEFVREEYEQAAERYEQYAQISDDHGRLAACIGKGRVLAKLGRLDQAITECERAASSPLVETGDSRSLALIANARLLLLGWMQGKPAYRQRYEETFRRLLVMLYHANAAGFALPADENLFIARKALALGADRDMLDASAELFGGASLQRLIDMEERCIGLTEQLPTARVLDEWQVGRFQRLPTEEGAFYGLVRRTGRGTCLALLSRDNVVRALTDYAEDFDDINVECRILDDAGQQVAGLDETGREPFATAPVSECFPGWTIRVFFRDGGVFERAASEQIAVYTWTGVLVILLILGSGAVAAKSIGKQVRLNRLKNDFIATVTHELKTPLASMRVLVDTLLEGNYRNPQQVTEYLQLVSRENERLSRLIDNFLTFSRMERNKQAFQMRPTSPVSIARTAAEAVQTKLSQGNCRFETDIPDALPDVKADHDAMVTVLVNLLDNAYKYSHDEKQIKLTVAVENGSVCFRVSDNGVGISRRAVKRIFRRFYQADRSLSRRAEGCGLGLSIAKFIVDAHHGTISVESKPGQGSTFTVTLPVVSST
jgi:signal transduction histidine kinase/tetratricopeptide (TPR) repeat protein